MKYRQFQQENVFINNGRTLATLCAFRTGLTIGASKIRYEVRAGKKGRGQVLAKAVCIFRLYDQEQARKKITAKVGGIEFMHWNDPKSVEKFESAGYIPDPFER